MRTRIGSNDVLYQVIDGISEEEVLQQLNKYGYARAKARKIGVWDSERNRFEKVRWIPLVNEPVLLVQAQEAVPDASSVGHFPGTNYPVSIRPADLVTHNTAVLGILGVGKTTLALELIQRMMAEGIKVICLDITNEYASKLGCNQPSTAFERMKAIGVAGKGQSRQNKEEGGSMIQFRSEMDQLLASFLSEALTPASNERILIIDPGAFEVWQQEGGLFQGSAAMASLTPTQITRLITESTLELVQRQGTTDMARVCLVFEEAHSLVPEWNSAASPGDQPASNGTAKAILQGRKYGLGCLLITQRTANVTKSILNQCNTIFAMRLFDATGAEFLKNYIGDDFASILSTMEDRHAVIFGKGSSCADPVLVRLNDREHFLAEFMS